MPKEPDELARANQVAVSKFILIQMQRFSCAENGSSRLMGDHCQLKMSFENVNCTELFCFHRHLSGNQSVYSFDENVPECPAGGRIRRDWKRVRSGQEKPPGLGAN